jgi:hypothetical protein
MLDANLLMPMLAAGAGGVVAIGVLVGIVAWMHRRNRAVADDPALWRGRDYVCPNCGGAMAQGWVMLGKGAIFSSRARGRPGLFAHIGKALPNTISMHLKPAANMAWHCSRCRLLLLDHDKLVH